MAKAERAKILTPLIRDLEIRDRIDFLDLAFRLERLEKQGITLEDLKEEKVERLEELLGYIEQDKEDNVTFQ